MSDAAEATHPPESPPHTGNAAYSIAAYSPSWSGRAVCGGRWSIELAPPEPGTIMDTVLRLSTPMSILWGREVHAPALD